jgi:hypothetical protein
MGWVRKANDFFKSSFKKFIPTDFKAKCFSEGSGAVLFIIAMKPPFELRFELKGIHMHEETKFDVAYTIYVQFRRPIKTI